MAPTELETAAISGNWTTWSAPKWAAAYWFCRLSGRSTSSEVYEKVHSVVDHVRRYYDHHLPAELRLLDEDGAGLATTMFVDGCFLMQYMMMMMVVGGAGATGTDPLLRKRMSPPNIRKDIFMLENQIPYLVLEALMEFTSVDVRGFIAKMGMHFFFGPRNNDLLLAREREREAVQPQPQARWPVQFGDYKPPHLLGLLLFHVTGSTPEPAAASHSHSHREGEAAAPPPPPSQPRSAAELAQIGVKLTPASATARLADMAFTRKPVLFAELSLSPLFLDDDTTCWLVNMAALEEAVVARDFIPMGARASLESFKLSSYLSVLAMLVDGEEDVRELRRANLLHSTLSNTQALAFFKGLGHNLRLGHQYHAVLEEIDRYWRDTGR